VISSSNILRRSVLVIAPISLPSFVTGKNLWLLPIRNSFTFSIESSGLTVADSVNMYSLTGIFSSLWNAAFSTICFEIMPTTFSFETTGNAFMLYLTMMLFASEIGHSASTDFTGKNMMSFAFHRGFMLCLRILTSLSFASMIVMSLTVEDAASL